MKLKQNQVIIITFNILCENRLYIENRLIVLNSQAHQIQKTIPEQEIPNFSDFSPIKQHKNILTKKKRCRCA